MIFICCSHFPWQAGKGKAKIAAKQQQKKTDQEEKQDWEFRTLIGGYFKLDNTIA